MRNPYRTAKRSQLTPRTLNHPSGTGNTFAYHNRDHQLPHPGDQSFKMQQFSQIPMLNTEQASLMVHQQHQHQNLHFFLPTSLSQSFSQYSFKGKKKLHLEVRINIFQTRM